MADRRMFSRKITEDDHFLGLSASAQALYLHLTMSADDDGFCNQVAIAMFRAHASTQDLDALLEKKYVYQFENGVVVIKHWRIANKLRKDRYTQTNFKEELSQLRLDENGAYTRQNNDGCQVVAEWLPDGCQVVAEWLPQDRLGKDRLGKDRLGKDRLGKDSIGEDRVGEVNKENLSVQHINYQKIVDAFNQTCISYPRVEKLTENRKKAIRARLNTYSEADFQRLFEKAEASDFLKGRNNRNWMATFDWLIKDSNMAKALEGNYDNRADDQAQEDVFAKYGV